MRGIGVWGLVLALAACSGGSDPEPGEIQPEEAGAEQAADDAAAAKEAGDDAPSGSVVELRAPASPEEEAALKRAGDGATELATRLRSRLMQAMSEGGPPAAIALCADEAQGITAQAGVARQAKVGRATDRPRNPVNAGPEWAVARLEAWKAGAEDQVAPVRGVVERPDGHAAVVMRPIRIEAPCLTCHGPSEQIPDEVKAVLTERYPEDQATGYALGDLRGVLWAEVPVPGEG